jgi:tetratricopeptide (TPR) repeat protein
MNWLGVASWVVKIQVVFGCIGIALAIFQIMKAGKTFAFLRVATYVAFAITVGGVAFGNYYAGRAPRSLRPIEVSAPAIAIAGYTEAIRLNPVDTTLFFRRGRADFHLHKYADAIRDFDRALDMSPNNPQYLASRGFAYLFTGDIRSAETDINRALASGYRDPELNMTAGMILHHDEKFQEAIDQYTLALSQSDLDLVNRCSTLINRGNAYRMLKLYAKAEEDDTSAIAICDSSSREDGFVNRGEDKWLRGDRSSAIADWGEALRLDPNDPVVFKSRAEAYIDEGHLDLAVADYDRYLQLRPDDAYTYLVRARLYERLGDLVRAQSDREVAQELTRTNRAKSYGTPKLLYPM